jgi:plastocyanin
MTVRAKNRVFVTGIAVAVTALLVTVLPMIAFSESDAVRGIDIVVRDMAFYVNDGTEPNPVIAVRAGERVRVRVRNEDAGMRHDFTIKSWTVATKLLDDRGEEDVVEFAVPNERGTHTYTCTPHRKMMTGTIRVE